MLASHLRIVRRLRERAATDPDRARGIYEKYVVQRTDGATACGPQARALPPLRARRRPRSSCGPMPEPLRRHSARRPTRSSLAISASSSGTCHEDEVEHHGRRCPPRPRRHPSAPFAGSPGTPPDVSWSSTARSRRTRARCSTRASSSMASSRSGAQATSTIKGACTSTTRPGRRRSADHFVASSSSLRRRPCPRLRGSLGVHEQHEPEPRGRHERRALPAVRLHHGIRLAHRLFDVRHRAGGARLARGSARLPDRRSTTPPGRWGRSRAADRRPAGRFHREPPQIACISLTICPVASVPRGRSVTSDQRLDRSQRATSSVLVTPVLVSHRP